ncbi:unnamed protein product [Blepharisma stoltei]|uniref:O-methyltransferase C-terminal domain-containing protein n=1 Tax=Blepharisma stoltei TaxID=1481888 RepID=A0AAU9J7I6_9CILI|nr:unnamed protein product [Blepharisma stoltei]
MLQHSDVDRKVQKILFGPQLGALLYSALDFNIPKLLSLGPKTAEDLSQETQVISDKLERVLLALESAGIFEYDEQSRRFSNNVISERFIDDTYADFVRLSLAPWQYDFLSVVSQCLMSDQTAPEVYYNATFTDFLSQKPQYLKQFVSGISSKVLQVSEEVGQAIDLRNARKVLEIGAHGGALIISLAETYRNFQGTIYDQTLYRQITEKKIHEKKLTNRIKVTAGNYIDYVPEGYDAIVMKCISGEYNDHSLDSILRNCRRALEKGNKLYFVDLMMDRAHQQYKFERYLDIWWWAITDGKVRSREELAPFFEKNGLRVINIRPAKTDWVVEAVAV